MHTRRPRSNHQQAASNALFHRFLTTSGLQVFHPNIDLDGNICLNILREDWKPVLSINSIIYGLQFLFLVRPFSASACCLWYLSIPFPGAQHAHAIPSSNHGGWCMQNVLQKEWEGHRLTCGLLSSRPAWQGMPCLSPAKLHYLERPSGT